MAETLVELNLGGPKIRLPLIVIYDHKKYYYAIYLQAIRTLLKNAYFSWLRHFFNLGLYQLNRLWVTMSPNVVTTKKRMIPKYHPFLNLYRFVYCVNLTFAYSLSYYICPFCLKVLDVFLAQQFHLSASL